MKYEVVIRHADGYEHVYARTRRHNGALAEAEKAMDAVRGYMRSRAEAGERIVEGPTLAGDYAVILLAEHGDVAQEVIIRERCGRHNRAMVRVCGTYQCGLCYEERMERENYTAPRLNEIVLHSVHGHAMMGA